jgi:hypothetical protein
MLAVNLILALVIVATLIWLVNSRTMVARDFRTLLNVILGVILVGILLWIVNVYIPMALSIKAILNIVVFVATCVRVLQALGLWVDLVALWSQWRSHRVS